MPIRVDFESDDSRLKAALERLQKELDKAAARSQKMADASKKSAAEAQREAAEHIRAQVGVQQQFQRVAAEVDRLTKRQRESKDEARQFDDVLQRFFHNGAAGLQQMLLGYVSVNAAIQLGTKLIQDRMEMQRKAAQTQVTEAGAQAKLLRNLADSEAADVLKEVDQISRDTGVSRKLVNVVASEAVSAKGSLTVDQAMDAVRQAVRIAPEDETEATAIAGGLLDVASATGSTDARKNLGALVAIQEESRAKKLESISQHLVPAITGVRERGDSFTDAAALGVAFTNVLKDPEGRMSGTGALQLAKQLDEFLPENDQYTRNQFGRRVLSKRGTGLSSTAERIEFLQQNPELAEDFLSQASFESKVDPFARALVQKPDSEVARNYDTLRRRLPTADEALSIAEGKIARMESIGIQRTAGLQRAVQTTAEDISAKDISSGEIAIGDQAIDDILHRSGRWFFERWASRLELQARSFVQSPREALASTLQDDMVRQAFKFNTRGTEEIADLINKLRTQPDELRPLPERPLRELPDFHYTGPDVPSDEPRRARRLPADMGPSREERRGGLAKPDLGDGAELTPAKFRQTDQQIPLLEEMLATSKDAKETHTPLFQDMLSAAKQTPDRQVPILERIASLLERNNQSLDHLATVAQRDAAAGGGNDQAAAGDRRRQLAGALAAGRDRNNHVEV